LKLVHTQLGAIMSDWFATLFGFSESAVLRGGGGFAEVQRSFRMDGDTLVSQANGRSFDIGPWEQVSLKTLRGRCVDAASVGHSRPETPAADAGAGSPGGHHRVVDRRDQAATFSNIGKRNAAALHKDPANGGAVFQVASQFNCLEMVGPGVTPGEPTASSLFPLHRAALSCLPLQLWLT
jgi:hypothetical protein